MCIAIRCIVYSLYLDLISRGMSVVLVMPRLLKVHLVMCLTTLKPWLLKMKFSCLSNNRYFNLILKCFLTASFLNLTILFFILD